MRGRFPVPVFSSAPSCCLLSRSSITNLDCCRLVALALVHSSFAELRTVSCRNAHRQQNLLLLAPAQQPAEFPPFLHAPAHPPVGHLLFATHQPACQPSQATSQTAFQQVGEGGQFGRGVTKPSYSHHYISSSSVTRCDRCAFCLLATKTAKQHCRLLALLSNYCLETRFLHSTFALSC
jgi:hypothetical protein